MLLKPAASLWKMHLLQLALLALTQEDAAGRSIVAMQREDDRLRLHLHHRPLQVPAPPPKVMAGETTMRCLPSPMAAMSRSKPTEIQGVVACAFVALPLCAWTTAAAQVWPSLVLSACMLDAFLICGASARQGHAAILAQSTRCVPACADLSRPAPCNIGSSDKLPTQ